MRKPHVCLLIAISLATIATTLGCSNAGNPTYTKLAFNSDRKVNPVTNLFLMNLDGSNVTPVPFNNGIYSPSSSADLTTIAFDSAGSYWVSNASGSAQTQLANAGSGFAIRVAPNGKKLILMAADPVSGAQHVWVMNVDGTGSLDLNSTFPSGINACFTGSFSADSAKIVMSCTGPVLSGIYTIKPDGTGLATVTTQGNFVDTPGFTPDGKKILFVSYSLTGPSTTGIVSVNLDGSGLTVLVNGAFEMEILNSNLYYTLFDPVATNDRIFKSNLDGTGAVALTDGSSSDSLSLSTD
jgi:Tol biopolymer transport system component